MKYNVLIIFKFSTISRLIDKLRYIYSRIYKTIKNIPTNTVNFINQYLRNIFFKINKFIRFLINDFLGIFRILDIRRLKPNKIYQFFNVRKYNFDKISKNVGVKKYKNLPTYFITLLIFLGFLYIFIPTFYNYDKLKIEKIICSNSNYIKCSINGKISYNFFPSPRIKIRDLIIKYVNNKRS